MASSNRRRLLFRWYVYLPILIATLYLIGAGVLFFAQDRLVYPGHSMQGRWDATFKPPTGSEIVHTRTQLGDNIALLFSPCPSAKPDAAPTVVFFYGNAMMMAYTLDEVRKFNAAGANVLVVEYPGYGLSSGKPSEPAFYSAIDSAWQYLQSRSDIDIKKIVSLGWSLGSGSATEMAKRYPVAGLVLAAPFTSITDMARRQAPLFPTSLLLRSRFDNELKLRDLTCPILIFHGRRDTLIPFSMGERLRDANPSHVTFVASDLGGHEDVFSVDDGLLITRLTDFLRSISAQQ